MLPEILFLAKISPLRIASSFRVNEFEALYCAIILILNSAIKNKGTTIRNYLIPDESKGEFQSHLKVYARENKLHVICSSEIKKIV